MSATRFRCPACGHWCNIADGYGWICNKRGGCGSEWEAYDPLEVRCPQCASAAGVPCYSGVFRVDPHVERHALAIRKAL
jgi:DNA-directed RNA polymerase subunit RPC12/RpoP